MSINTINSASSPYDLLKLDTEALLGLVNKYVTVKLIKDTSFVGFVHSIDPVQHSIILLQPENDTYIVNIIPGHAVLDVIVSVPAPNFKPLEYQRAIETPDEIITKKQKLMSWFKKNLLQITESEEKILFGSVSILPPYGPPNICTDNPVVAMQLRRIIENMPSNFEPDE